MRTASDGGDMTVSPAAHGDGWGIAPSVPDAPQDPGLAERADVPVVAGMAEFVERSWPDLYRTAYLITGSSQDAEDAVQEALAVVVQKWDRVSRTDSPTAYSRRIIASQAYRRSRRRRAELERLVLWRRAERGQEDSVAEHARRDELVSALQQLPPRMRAAVVLRFYGDLSEREAADALGCSIGAVKSQSHKGLARLRELLPATDGEGNRR